MSRPSAAELLGKASRAGADEAFASLVHQFTDPMAFLRELVQNSLDAGATRIEVNFEFRPDADSAQVSEGNRKKKKKRRSKGEAAVRVGMTRLDPDTPGVAEVRVVDNGEGMDERIIDDYLLTLFRSTKEGDLTKIGKFGIGFVSTFAVEPAGVVVRTGRAGQWWRVVFGPDGGYEKYRLDVPVEGTSVRVVKPMDARTFAAWRSRGRDTVAYWCAYAEADIRVDAEKVAKPFALAAPLAVRHTAPGSEVWVGLAPAKPLSEGRLQLDPSVTFCNRGLTLLSTDHVPGYPQLNGLSLLAKSRYLEHTLTRDNVLQDEQYHKLIAIVSAAVAEQLAPALIAHMRKLARALSGDGEAPDPGPPGLPACWSYAGLSCIAAGASLERQPVVPCLHGPPVAPAELKALCRLGGKVVWAERANPLTALLFEQGVHVIRADGPEVDALARLTDLAFEEANQLARTALPAEVDETGRALFAALAGLLDRIGLKVERVEPGRLAYPGARFGQGLFLRQVEPYGLTRLGKDDRPGLFGGARCLVIDPDHPLAARCLRLARADVPMAVALLAHGIVSQEDPGGRAAGRVALAGLELAERAAADPAPVEAGATGEHGHG